MKTEITLLFIGALLCLAVPNMAMAQQLRTTQASLQAQTGQPASKYTYQIFLAPNKSFGYNIFKDNRILFHQPAFSKPLIYSDEMLTKEAQANKAAMLAIEKMKKGQNAELSGPELRKITAP